MPDTLSEPCELESGHHYCVTHDQHFRNNFEANSHERGNQEPGECVFAWWCAEHGPERAS